MKILTIAHNHPDFHPGGTEVVAWGLAQAFRTRGLNSVFLGALDSKYRPEHAGTAIQSIPGREGAYLFRGLGFDPFMQVQTRLDMVLMDLRWLLQDLAPDIVHIHHLNGFGVELLALIRQVVPRAKVVLTLHDYYLICPHDGLMVRTAAAGGSESADGQGGALCDRASVDRCYACFPEKIPAVLQLRKLHILRHLEHVDRFLSPSRFLRQRFVDWGLPSDRIQVMRNGIDGDPAAPDQASGRRDPPRRFATFGNLRGTKGSLLIARAALRAIEHHGADLSLEMNGEALFQPESFKAELAAIAERSGGRIRLNGRYEHKDLDRLMQATDWVVAPSTWWENAPLVIDEAFRNRRPVVCSDIGGMAESVRDGIDGVHVPVGRVEAWAEALARLSGDTEGWARMVTAIAPPTSLEAMADACLGVYSELADLDRHAGPQIVRAPKPVASKSGTVSKSRAKPARRRA